MRRALAALLILAASCSAPKNPASQPQPSPTTEQLLRFAAVGDTGDGSADEAAVAEAIAKSHDSAPLDLLLHLGDLIYEKGDPADYERKFATPYRPVIDRSIEVRAVLGNHDIQTDPAQILKLFEIPSRYYTFTRGNVQFFALDTSKGSLDEEQILWLKRELTNSQAQWKVAFTHVPGLSAGLHGNNQPIRTALEPLFEEHGVRLSLAGHDHNYQRAHPVGGTTYIVSGGGCCPRESVPADFLAARATGLHFLEIEVLGTNMTIKAVAATGEVLDRVEIGLTDA